MIVVWGKPVKFTTYEELDSWDDCLETCYESDDCVLVHKVSSGCQLFRFGKLKSVRKSNSTDSQIVGFKKTISSDTCPSNDNPPLFGQNSTSEFYTNNQTLYNSTITTDGDTWTITYHVVTCPISSKPFPRDLVSVCIGFRSFNGTGNHTDASELCKTNRGMSLTGPYNSEEWSYLTAQSNDSIWLDGKNVDQWDVFVMEDDTHNGTNAYPWKKGQPDSYALDNCLYRISASGGMKVGDYPCSSMFHGATCRINILKEEIY